MFSIKFKIDSISKPKIIGFVLSILIGFSLASTALFFFGNREASETDNVLGGLTEPEDLELNLESPNLAKELTILLLGYGGAGHDGRYLTDVIQVAHFDFEKSKLVFISIPRDLWVKLPSGLEGKINSALTMGMKGSKDIQEGAKISKSMAEMVTGIPISYFIGIDFVGFQRAIGIELDGIEVNVAETLDDPWYPIKGEELNLCDMSPQEIQEVHEKYSGFELERQFECRYERILFKPGKVHMEGGDALKYTRSRHGSAGGDFSRSKRQQEVLQAIRDKLLSLGAIDDIPGFFTEIVKHTSTDIDSEILESLIPSIKAAKDLQIVNINLDTTNVFTESKAASGAFIVIPRGGFNSWSAVREYVKNEISK